MGRREEDRKLEDRKREERDREQRAARQQARKDRDQWKMDITRNVTDNPEALEIIHGLRDTEISPFSGRELSRPLLRFWDAGPDGSTQMPEAAETSRFYNESTFSRDHLPLIGFYCSIDNPYFKIETHHFRLMTIYKQDEQEIHIPYERLIDIDQASFGWTSSARPRDGWTDLQWDVFVYADSRLVASGNFFMH